MTADEVETVLEMMRFHEIAPDVQAQVRAWHDRARDLVEAAVAPSSARDELFELVESLEVRAG